MRRASRVPVQSGSHGQSRSTTASEPRGRRSARRARARVADSTSCKQVAADSLWRDVLAECRLTVASRNAFAGRVPERAGIVLMPA